MWLDLYLHNVSSMKARLQIHVKHENMFGRLKYRAWEHIGETRRSSARMCYLFLVWGIAGEFFLVNYTHVFLCYGPIRLVVYPFFFPLTRFSAHYFSCPFVFCGTNNLTVPLYCCYYFFFLIFRIIFSIAGLGDAMVQDIVKWGEIVPDGVRMCHKIKYW